jgi:two-component system, sensor histidine kinase and response regulator
MGGQMWVDSTVGEGSTFCFQINLDKASIAHRAHPPIRSAELEGRTAILIDDNRVALSITSRTLQEWGMKPLAFSSVTEALGHLSKTENKPEVALIDMMRPDLEAPEAMRQFTSHPSFRGIHLVVLTSEASPGSARLCQSIGFEGYLPKPVPRGAMRDVLCTIFGTEPQSGQNSIITRHSAREELFKNKEILLIDDNPSTEAQILKLLSQLGTQVVPSYSMAEAVNEISKVSFDLILLAIDSLAGKSLDALLTLSRTSGNVPVIGMTGDTQKVEAQSCLKAGMSDIISLPANKEVLVRMIRKWCSE